MKVSNRKKNIVTALILSMLVMIVLYVINGIGSLPDTKSYYQAWEVFKAGNIDLLRTPIYPLFIGLINDFFGNTTGPIITVFLQCTIFLFSVYPAYLISLTVFNSERIAFIVTLFYCTAPFISIHNLRILTESLSISGATFFIYFIIRYYKSSRNIYNVAATIILVVLLLLRPSFLYLLFSVGFMWLILLCSKKKCKLKALAGLIGTFVSSLVIVGYMYMFWQEHGLFTSSAIGTLNQYYSQRTYGVMDPEVIDHPEFRHKVEESIKKYGKCNITGDGLYYEALSVINSYGVVTVQDAVRKSMYNHKTDYFYHVVLYAFQPITDLFTGERVGANAAKVFIYIYLFLYSILLIMFIRKKKTIPWVSMLLYLAGVSNMILSIVGAQGGWGRLVMPSMLCYGIIFMQVICFLTKHKSYEAIAS